MLDIFFSQSLTGFFFMLLDEPIDWENATDKDALVEYALDHHRITRINQAMLDQYSATEEMMLNATPRAMFLGNIDEGRSVWRQLFEQGKLQVETNETKMDGTPMIIEGDYICLYDDHGRITGHFGVQHDITERREMHNKLEEARLRAEQANQAKSRFLANMSHEIRTPLNGVIGFTDLLKRTKLDANQQLYVENANTAGIALLEIINNILDVSKIEAGKLDLDFAMHDLVEICEQVVDIVKYQASQKGLAIHLIIDPAVPRIAYIDATRVRQVLLNLIGNAVKFTEKGEVVLSIAFTPSATKNEGVYDISVKDTGIGINESQSNRLFKAFSQGDASINRRYGGTGLGLLISDLLVKKMGSSIELKTSQGRGSTFSFSLNTKNMPGSLAIPAEPIPVKKVLLIDSSETQRGMLSSLFAH